MRFQAKTQPYFQRAPKRFVLSKLKVLTKRQALRVGTACDSVRRVQAQTSA